MVEAPPLQRVVKLPGPVRCHDHGRKRVGRDPADLGDRHRELRQDLQQEGLELVVGPVELVDQQHRAAARPDRRQQRPFHEELGTEEILDVGLGGRGIHRAHRDELPRVVPFVQGLRRVDALVALEPDEPSTEQRREHLPHLGLADPGFPLQKQRLAERQGQVDGGGERPVGEIGVRAELLAQLIDGPEGEFGGHDLMLRGNQVLRASAGAERRPE